MPGTRVPVYDTPSVAPSQLPGVRVEAPGSPMHMASMLGQQGREQEQIGQGLMKAGDAAANIQLDMQEQANQVRVQDALNQTRQSALNLTYDPQQGYQSIKGAAALNRESGKPLAEEYGAKLTENMNAISGSLGNDRQRQMFAQHSAEISNSFKEGLQRHTLEQFNTYQHGVADDAIKLGETQAGLAWDNPQAVEQSVDSVKAATYQKAQLTGVPATAATQQAESGVRAKVIESALENNNPGYAMAYFNKFKGNGSGAFGGLTPDDILKVQGKINTQMDSHIALSAVNEGVKELQPAIAPTNMDRMGQITRQSESGNQRFANGRDGALTESTTGAKGEMQVQDDTNKNPGFGVKPAKDDSADERARVGNDYLAAMVTRYGGADKAWAAYNAGPGATDEALVKAKLDGKPGEWLSYLPKETQDYVSKNMQALQTGDGAQPLPTKSQFINNIVAKLGDNPRPAVVKLAQEQATKQFDDLQASQKEIAGQALGAAQKALIQNKGNFAQLPPSIIEGLIKSDPENYKKAQDFADSISKNDVKTNMDAYNAAYSHPDELAKMSDTDFMQFAKTNFSQSDQEKVIKLRTNEQNATTDESSGAINSKAVNSVLNERLLSLGIDPTPQKTDTDGRARIGGIQHLVNEDIYAQQQQLGRKLTSQEIEQHIDGMFLKQTTGPGALWGLFGNTTKSVMATTIGDVPSETVGRITDFLKDKKGIVNPSDTDVLNIYRQMVLAK